MDEHRLPLRRPFLIAAVLVSVFLALPLFVTLPVSLTPTRYVAIPTEELSLRHYREILTNPLWLRAFADSFLVALASAALALILGTGGAVGVWRATGFAVGALRALALLPLVAPPVVTALALSRAWVTLGLFDTVPGVILAHAIVSMPFVFLTVSAGLAGLDPRIEQAARSLGAGPMRTVASVLLPNLVPSMAAGGLFAFIISWDEIVVTLFVSSRSVFTLPRQIWSGIRDNIDPAVAAVSVVTIVMTVVIGTSALALRRIGSGERSSR